MATVYEARATTAGVGRTVALKRIHPHLSKDVSFREMFLDEARIVSQINHPNVCRILDYGDGADGAFIVMELLTGTTVLRVLKALVTRAPSDQDCFRFVTTLIIEAAEGLHAAHEARNEDGEPLEIVHRDVSPSNLFLTNAGEVKVLDFGIAKARNRIHQTMPDEVKGKFSYMSPEQTHGRAERRSDIWALGVIHHQLLTLRPLFRRATQPETILAVLNGPIPRPDEIRPSLADLPCDIALIALQRDPNDRPSTALEYADRLQLALQPLGGPMSRRERQTYADALLARDDEKSDAPKRAQPEPVEDTLEEISIDVSERLSRTNIQRPRRSRTLPIILSTLVLLSVGTWAAWPSDTTATASTEAEGAEELAAVGTPPEPTTPGEPAEETPASEPVQETPPSEPAQEPVRPTMSTGPSEMETSPRDEPRRPPQMQPMEEVREAEPPLEGPPGEFVVPNGIAVCIDNCAGRNRAVGGLVPARRSRPPGEYTIYQIPYADSAAQVPDRLVRKVIPLAPGQRLNLRLHFQPR